MLGANPDATVINGPATFNEANERIEGSLVSELRRLEPATPTEFSNFPKVLREVFAVNKLEFTQSLNVAVRLVAVFELDS